MLDLSKASPEALVALGEDLVKMMKSPAVQEIALRKITNVNDVQLAYDSADKYVFAFEMCVKVAWRVVSPLLFGGLSNSKTKIGNTQEELFQRLLSSPLATLQIFGRGKHQACLCSRLLCYDPRCPASS